MKAKNVRNEYLFKNVYIREMDFFKRDAWSSLILESIWLTSLDLSALGSCDKWERILGTPLSQVLEMMHLKSSAWRTTFQKSDRKRPSVLEQLSCIATDAMDSAYAGNSELEIPFFVRPMTSKEGKALDMDYCKALVFCICMQTERYGIDKIPVAYITFDTEECCIKKEGREEQGASIHELHILKAGTKEPLEDVTLGELLDFIKCRTVILAKMQMQETLYRINEAGKNMSYEKAGMGSLQMTADAMFHEMQLLKTAIDNANRKG